MHLCRPFLVVQSLLRASTASRRRLKLSWCSLGPQAGQLVFAAIPPTTLMPTEMLSRWQLQTASHCWCAALHDRTSRWTVFGLTSRQVLLASGAHCQWHTDQSIDSDVGASTKHFGVALYSAFHNCRDRFNLARKKISCLSLMQRSFFLVDWSS